VFAPFRGVRYAPQRVTGLAEVTSPPYDVISDRAVEQLLGSDPHNVVRLILPRDDPDGQGRYQAAGRLLRDWIAEGVLVPDPGPALYVYEERGPGSGGNQQGPGSGGNQQGPGSGEGNQSEGLQRGLIGAVALTPPSAGIVLPHEEVMPGPVSGRRQLMEATGANLEPIFLLYQGGGPGGGESGSSATRLVNQVADEREPLLELVTDDGVTHRMWAVTAPSELAMIAADLAPRQALIADGHHRYAAYREVQAGRDQPGPWDYGLALLVDSTAFPPRIDPIHRVIPGLPATSAIELAKSAFSVRPLVGGAGLPRALEALADAGTHGPAFLLAGAGHFYLLTDPDPVQLDDSMPPGRSARWRGLATSVLHQLLIQRVWRLPDDEQTVRMVHHDAEAAIEAAVKGAGEAGGGTAVICNPARVEDVLAIAAGGETVPRKSTSFGPKPRTGLVIRTFAQG
jgi:uncharacterized protein (DUF1015 family)